MLARSPTLVSPNQEHINRLADYNEWAADLRAMLVTHIWRLDDDLLERYREGHRLPSREEAVEYAADVAIESVIDGVVDADTFKALKRKAERIDD